MPNHKSAWKRMRQNEIRRARNKAHRSHLRKAVKSFRSLDDAAAAREQIPGVVSAIDKAVKKGLIHSRKAARLKSRLSRAATGA